MPAQARKSEHSWQMNRRTVSEDDFSHPDQSLQQVQSWACSSRAACAALTMKKSSQPLHVAIAPLKLL